MEQFGISLYDAISVAIGTAGAVLLIKKSIWCWCCGMICNVMWLFLFMERSLLIAAGLQVTYFLFSGYGIIRWRLERVQKPIPPLLEHTGTLIALAIFGLAVLKTRFTGLNSYCELLAVSLLIAANWLTARQHRYCWYFWISGDLVFGLFLWNAGIYALFLMQVIYFCLSVWGLIAWRKANAIAAMDAPAQDVDV